MYLRIYYKILFKCNSCRDGWDMFEHQKCKKNAFYLFYEILKDHKFIQLQRKKISIRNKLR